MTLTRRSSLVAVTMAVADALGRHRVQAVLTGGACAALHTNGAYVSKDIDFVVQGRATRAQVDGALAEVGFTRTGDRYRHPDVPYYVEFPAGPLGIGADLDITPVTVTRSGRRALALSATDSCRDRLAAFYHWNDRQSLKLAVDIAVRARVNRARIRRWSESEGFAAEYGEFERRLADRTRRKAVAPRTRAG